MTVKRIVANIKAAKPSEAHAFYRDLLGLEVAMDQGWIVTFAAGGPGPVQVSVASEGGSGTAVPALSVEVEDVDAVYDKARSAGLEIVRALTDEPWGVRRFYVGDPFGTLVNILSHSR